MQQANAITNAPTRLPPVVRPPRCRCTIFAACNEVAPTPSAREERPASAAPALLDRLRSAAVAGALSAALALAPLSTAGMHAHAASLISNDTPVVDLARVVPSGRLEGLQQQLKDLESETGWRVRMLTRYGPSQGDPTIEEIRAGWKVDDRTVVIFVDPTSPNIMSFSFGQEVRSILRPQFFTELQGRYGNLFAVRDAGESASVLNMVDTLTGCLAQGGCFAVPGLSEDHYYFTLALSVAGGIIAGSAARLEPQGFVQRRWVWPLLFSPLWGTLFVSFGLGPIISRTADVLPLVANTAAFLAAAAAVGFYPSIGRATGLSTTDESDAQ